MAEIYSSTTIVLKAASQADCQAGLYKKRGRDPLAPFQTKVKQQDGEEYLVALTITSAVCGEPLDTRGWCFQEFWLARRMIVFGTR